MQPTVNPNIPSETQIKPPKPWFKIVLLIGLGLMLISSLVFAGYQLGKKQSKPVVQLSPTPLAAATLLPTPTAVATPTPNPTAEWKTYTNTTYGFEIKYPPDPDWGEVAITTGIDINFGVQRCILMTIRENSKNLGVEKFCEEELKKLFPPGTENPEPFSDVPCWHVLNKSPERMIIGGKQAFQCKNVTGPLSSTHTLISANNFLFEVIKVDQPCNSLNTDETYDLMLSTFKFLD